MGDAPGWAAFVGGLVGTLVLMADRGFKDGLRLAWFLATLAVPGWFAFTFRSVGLDAVTVPAPLLKTTVLLAGVAEKLVPAIESAPALRASA